MVCHLIYHLTDDVPIAKADAWLPVGQRDLNSRQGLSPPPYCRSGCLTWGGGASCSQLMALVEDPGVMCDQCGPNLFHLLHNTFEFDKMLNHCVIFDPDIAGTTRLEQK